MISHLIRDKIIIQFFLSSTEMVRHESIARQRLIFHFCETCQLPVRHANKSGHKDCSFREDCSYIYCLSCRTYEESNMKANSDSAKAFIVRHTPCALQNGRKGMNLASNNEKKKLQRLFSKDRPVEGVLSQVDEPQQPPKKAPVPRICRRYFQRF